MTIDRELLLANLRTCRPGLDASANSMDGTDCFLFKQKRLHTYNSYLSVSIPCDFGFEGALPAAEFLGVVSAFKGKTIEITQNETSLTLTCGRAKATVMYSSESMYKQILNILPTNPEWKPLPEGFLNDLKSCVLRGVPVYAAKKLDGVFVDNKAIFSTDSVVISCTKLFDSVDKFWLTTRMVMELAKFTDVEGYVLQDNWAIFKSGEMIFACRRYLDEYYPLDELKTVIANHKMEKMRGKLPVEFLDAVNNALIMGKSREERLLIDLEFQKEGIVVSSHNASGDYQEFMEAPIEDWESLKITVDGTKIKQALIGKTDVDFYLGYVNDVPNAFVLHQENWTSFFLVFKDAQ